MAMQVPETVKYINNADDDLIRHLYYLPQGIKRLESLGEVVHVDKDRILNVVNEVPDYCYLVKEGRVICYEITLAGVQRVYSFMEPDSIFLEECLLLDAPSPVFFKTMVPSTLVRISKCALKHAFKHDIDIVMDICQAMAAKFLSAMGQIRISQQKPAEWKICRLLQIFMEHYGADYDGKVLIAEKISQQMIADMLGINRVTVAKKFKEMKDSSMLEQINGYLCIRSAEALQKHMDLMR